MFDGTRLHHREPTILNDVRSRDLAFESSERSNGNFINLLWGFSRLEMAFLLLPRHSVEGHEEGMEQKFYLW